MSGRTVKATIKQTELKLMHNRWLGQEFVKKLRSVHEIHDVKGAERFLCFYCSDG